MQKLAILLPLFIFFSFPLFSIEECESPEKECILPSARDEKELFSHINCESRRLYNSLDCKGKNRALELFSKYKNKNLAVQEAAKEMGIRQRDEYPHQKDYQKQIQERSGQTPYNRRYGY